MSKVKCTRLLGFAVLAVFASAGCAASNSNASIAVTQSSQASILASASVAHALAASGQAALAVSSVPFAIGGVVLGGAGGASGRAAKASINAASAPATTALPVTDQTITVIPPNQALKK